MSGPIGSDVYCRVSSAGQEDNTSLESHEAACRVWAGCVVCWLRPSPGKCYRVVNCIDFNSTP
jgi:hypothetical protein